MWTFTSCCNSLQVLIIHGLGESRRPQPIPSLWAVLSSLGYTGTSYDELRLTSHASCCFSEAQLVFYLVISWVLTSIIIQSSMLH
jgi:hypothetical protein